MISGGEVLRSEQAAGTGFPFARKVFHPGYLTLDPAKRATRRMQLEPPQLGNDRAVGCSIRMETSANRRALNCAGGPCDAGGSAGSWTSIMDPCIVANPDGEGC